MFDSDSVLFDIRIPFTKKKVKLLDGGIYNDRGKILFTIWHKDPCTDGTDDSCGRFLRSRHGDAGMLEKIKNRISFDWDEFFDEEGNPKATPLGITLNWFYSAYWEYCGYNREKTVRFLQRNLIDIMIFSENPIDNTKDGINQRWGKVSKKDRIESTASMLYGWILRAECPWYKNPLFHIHHWEVQCPPLQKLRKYLFDRCQHCGGRFGYNESVHSNYWHVKVSGWFKSRENVYHGHCLGSTIPACGTPVGSGEQEGSDPSSN